MFLDSEYGLVCKVLAHKQKDLLQSPGTCNPRNGKAETGRPQKFAVQPFYPNR